MEEKKNYLYRILHVPAFYTLFQNAVGTPAARMKVVKQFIKPKSGMRVLDVGCGPGDMRPHLGDVNYTGMDLNADYIRSARINAMPGDQYYVGNVVTNMSFQAHSFDLILLMGILHHLNDEQCRLLLLSLAELLSPEGRIVSLDGVYIENQRMLSKQILDWDVGQHVRTREQYTSLCDTRSLSLKVTVLNDLLRIPYDHCAMILALK
jgi:SAM-dependent methyltransferase